MNYDEFNDYVQERWDNILDIVEEGKITDKAMKAMIKFSKSKNPVNKALQKHGRKEADKYFKKQKEKKLAEMEHIAEYVANMAVTEIERHGSEVTGGEVKTNDNGTKVKINIKFKPKLSDNDADDITNKIYPYLSRNSDAGKIGVEFEVGITEKGFSCIINIGE